MMANFTAAKMARTFAASSLHYYFFSQFSQLQTQEEINFVRETSLILPTPNTACVVYSRKKKACSCKVHVLSIKLCLFG